MDDMTVPEPPPALFTIIAGQAAPATDAAAVGNKAFNLMRLAACGLPVPPAFALPTTWWCRKLSAADPALRQTLAQGLARLETATGLRFGSARRPLLVSVRSGAAFSMPGMLETVLNIGLNPASVDGLIRHTGNPRLAWDNYRRLIQNYAEVVAGLPVTPFATLVTAALRSSDAVNERMLDFRALRTLTHALLERYEQLAGSPFPADPIEQLAQAVAAVWRSWDAPKAAAYRRMNNLPDDSGTAVTVQAMVFGNGGVRSGAGVGFTRNPATGAPELYFDFCSNGQGEDVVSGRHTVGDSARMRRLMPASFDALHAARARLEAVFRDMQDFEFTVQDGEFFLLQTRAAKRTSWAALQAAVDMVREGLVTSAEALRLLSGFDLDKIGRTRFAAPPPLAAGVAAGLGVANGTIALTAEAVDRFTRAGQTAILVRPDTVTDDIAALDAAAGLLTQAGSRTSHAAVVARQLGKVCLVGCRELSIDAATHQCWIGPQQFAEGDTISLDGNAGAIYAGTLPVIRERPEEALAIVAQWQRDAVEGQV
jgi:pyruvate, orthophosphate dikinase